MTSPRSSKSCSEFARAWARCRADIDAEMRALAAYVGNNRVDRDDPRSSAMTTTEPTATEAETTTDDEAVAELDEVETDVEAAKENIAALHVQLNELDAEVHTAKGPIDALVTAKIREVHEKATEIAANLGVTVAPATGPTLSRPGNVAAGGPVAVENAQPGGPPDSGPTGVPEVAGPEVPAAPAGPSPAIGEANAALEAQKQQEADAQKAQEAEAAQAAGETPHTEVPPGTPTV